MSAKSSEAAEPVLISNRYVADVFYDDVLIEVLPDGLCRLRLIRNRRTTDGVSYREPVINLVCLTSKVIRQAFEVARAVTAASDLDKVH